MLGGNLSNVHRASQIEHAVEKIALSLSLIITMQDNKITEYHTTMASQYTMQTTHILIQRQGDPKLTSWTKNNDCVNSCERNEFQYYQEAP